MLTPVLSPPTHSPFVKVEFPAEHVLLVTLNRPEALNTLTEQMSSDLDNVLNWFAREPDLWVLVIAGAGRFFCAGADLKDWSKNQDAGASKEQVYFSMNLQGFASISRRLVAKPIIAAVVGGAYGGGMELLLNCDLVVANEQAKFALPEVKMGVVAAQGGIPRLFRNSGHQLASEMLLLGRPLTAQEAKDRFGLINVLTPTTAEVVPAALGLAREVIASAPAHVIQETKRELLASMTATGLEDVPLYRYVDRLSSEGAVKEDVEKKEELGHRSQKRKDSAAKL